MERVVIRIGSFVFLVGLIVAAIPCVAETGAPLPEGVKAVWDLDKAGMRADRHLRANLHQRAVAFPAGGEEFRRDSGGQLGFL